MNETWLTESLAVLWVGAQALVAWAVWSVRRVFVRTEDCNRLAAAHAAEHRQLENRLLLVEHNIQQLPDAEGFAQLTRAVESLRGDIKVMDQRISGMDRLLVRLERCIESQEEVLRRQPL